MWKLRPAALTSPNYATMTVETLYELYMQDNARATKEGVCVPPKPTPRLLRTCQWNVHQFEPSEEVPDAHKLARRIADRVLETNADVIILNEFGVKPLVTNKSLKRSWSDQPADIRRERLERHGYTFHTSSCYFPMVVATKLPVVGPVVKFGLDMSRAVVAVPVAPPQHNNKSNKGTTTTTPLWIYGTHLEAGDDAQGKYRRSEMKQFLAVLQRHPELSLESENVGGGGLQPTKSPRLHNKRMGTHL
ncbi:expressed unknown protein [Seminavis robusta]|uniref:Endonuclease/exonuclease/phosphatase domain-containing protein n=1 Tax=Seminavis robusta TaxID=568900 RepID=A0A9N8HRV7_9STRA|nr:expressed unknown protein [Seminavis robusta]|eukprot:Sro1109_g242270.1 n/a (247) ;mRNA; f:12245-12985